MIDGIVGRIQDGFTSVSSAFVGMAGRLDQQNLLPGVPTCGLSSMVVSELLNMGQLASLRGIILKGPGGSGMASYRLILKLI